MSAATLERSTDVERVTAAGRAAETTRTRQLRPGRGSGRRTRPVGRSVSGVPAPSLARATRASLDDNRRLAAGSRGCSAESAVLPRPARASEVASTGWRLTNRGIAVVLITGALLTAAAITVITATAITVTSPGYHSTGSALARP